MTWLGFSAFAIVVFGVAFLASTLMAIGGGDD